MSLLDNDFYKFTMQQAVLHNFPTASMKYLFVCRTTNVDLRPYLKEIKERIEILCTKKMAHDELDYLSQIRFLKKDYINYLEDFTLKLRFIKLEAGKEQLEISIEGDWASTILFEVPILSIVSEVYSKSIMPESEAHKIGEKNLDEKIAFFKGLKNPFVFFDFGTRRRYSRKWQDYMISKLIKELPSYFRGTSNVYLAKKHNITPMGTMAHEFIQAGMGLGKTQLVNAQKYMLEIWASEYRGDLGIALTDTIKMDAFLKDFDLYLAKLYDGCRHDSGDPFTWGEKLIKHYEKFKIDPKTKTLVFSDSLNFKKAAEIHDAFSSRAKVNFGIGTNLSNDVGVNPLSVVLKLIRVNSNPVAKISDEEGKLLYEDREFLSYLKKVYNI